MRRHWYYSVEQDAFILGLVEVEGEYAKPIITINRHDDLPGLVAVLEEAGFIKPRLDDRIRAEDLKITHRLLDILGTSISKSKEG